MAHDVPAILQERLEWITVLECRASDPSKLLSRQMTRRELWESSHATASRPLTSAPLTLRDLRRLDPTTSHHNPPVILIRHGCILFNVSRLGTGQTRASLNVIIHHDRLCLLTHSPDDRCARAVHRELVRLAGSSRAAEVLPFEFLALEAALLHTCFELHHTTNALCGQV